MFMTIIQTILAMANGKIMLVVAEPFWWFADLLIVILALFIMAIGMSQPNDMENYYKETKYN